MIASIHLFKKLIPKIELIGLLFLLLLIGYACQPVEEPAEEDDILLEKVYNKALYFSEIKDMIPDNSTTQDSALMVNSLIERWVRESVLMHEAEKNIPKDLNIDQLVRDYRSSLVRHNYEKTLVEIDLDSTITKEEATVYYEANKNQFKLEDPILRCYFIKISKELEDLDKLHELWTKRSADNYKDLLEYCNNNATVYMLEDSSWYDIHKVALQLPKGTLTAGNLNSRKNLVLEDNEFKYYLEIFETLSKDKIPPLAYIEDQAKRVILHKRKIKLLENKVEEMYDREIGKNNIKIFTQ